MTLVQGSGRTVVKDTPNRVASVLLQRFVAVSKINHGDHALYGHSVPRKVELAWGLSDLRTNAFGLVLIFFPHRNMCFWSHRKAQSRTNVKWLILTFPSKPDSTLDSFSTPRTTTIS